MSSLRSGFKNLVRGGQSSSKKRSPGETFLWILILAVVVILLVLALLR